MQYINEKLFNEISESNKIYIIDTIISELTQIKEDINNNSNGRIFIKYIKFNKEEIKEIIDELKEEYDDSTDEKDKKLIKDNIKKEEKKIKIAKDILNITSTKKEYYDDNEGWHTTHKNMDVEIKLKNNFKLKFCFNYEYNGYDRSEDLYHRFYIYENDKQLKLNVDYYEENDEYFNGIKIKEKNSINNLQDKINIYCNENNIDFDNLDENKILNIVGDIKKESSDIKKQINQNEKIKNTSWTVLLNTILSKFKDINEYESFFDKLD